MAIDKSIDYVDQDGYKNYTKNSDSVTVPRKFKARKGAPGTKLAYITDAEEKQLKKQNPGTPHKGPSNVPSYDSFDAEGSYTSGAAMSAAERGGSQSARDRAEIRASNIGGEPGERSQLERDIRSSAIAAGAGQRVNPGFFDSRNVISPFELANARAFSRDPNNLFAKQAMRNTRGGGLMGFLTSGGILGNLIKGLGQRLGLGRTYNQPTYDMRGLNTRVYEAIPGASVNPSYYNDLDNEGLLSLVGTGGIINTVPFDADTFDDDVNLMNTKPMGTTTFLDEFPPTTKSDDNRVLPKNLDLGLPNDLYAEIKPNTLKQLKNMGIFKEGQKSPYTDKNELRMLVPSLNNATDEELDQIIKGTYTI